MSPNRTEAIYWCVMRNKRPASLLHPSMMGNTRYLGPIHSPRCDQRDARHAELNGCGLTLF